MTAKGLIQIIAFILTITGGFVLGLWLSPRHEATTTTTIDTVVHYRPIPVNDVIDYKRMTLPRLLFAPADTVVKAVLVADNNDSIEVDVPVETRVYQDSTYRAVVSGAVVGDIHPTLEEINIYQHNTVTVESAKVPKLRPYIAASGGIYGSTLFNVEAGVLINGHHLPKVGYTNIMGKNIVEVGYGYIF